MLFAVIAFALAEPTAAVVNDDDALSKRLTLVSAAVHTTILGGIVLLAAYSLCAAAAQTAVQPAAESAFGSDMQLAAYPADFFARYKPSTALDMVRQLPGFQIDDGNSSRGFGGTVGNIRVNDKYPSAKSDTPTALLARIPVTQVERIELIRGQVREVDLQGYVVVANIVLRQNVSAAIQWEANWLHSAAGPEKPGFNVSVSDRWADIDFNLGLDLERGANGESGSDMIYDGQGALTEIRNDRERETGIRLTGLILSSSTWLGETFVRLNTKISYVAGPDRLWSERVPQVPGALPSTVFIYDDQKDPTIEFGLDAEHRFTSHLTGKAILLATVQNTEVASTQQNTDPEGLVTLTRQADSKTPTRETIARYEIDWSGLPNHIVQVNLEGAFNSLDGSLAQTDDTGAGPQPVIVPGANSRVEERRGDIFVKDTWSKNRITLEYGLGAEASTITQTGDVEQQRDFFFIKPQALLTYSPGKLRQYRFLLQREIAQLDFADFVSATVFEDDDLALGNPDLRPSTTWLAEMSHERRISTDSVVTLTLFHHWISDVQDLLPLTADFEVPGNIGDGTRWGVRFESTMPLDRLGIKGAKLDFKMRWQKSSVTDPVTGQSRQLTANCCFRGPPDIKLTSENDYAFDIAFRQDFDESKFAWGWDVAEQADRPRFKVNELEIYDEGMEVNMFAETTRWFGIKIKIEGRNLLDYAEKRDRVLFVGDRDLTPVSSRIYRERFTGRRINLVLSGNF